MKNYIPPCEVHTDESFEFVGKIEEIDEETGDILYWITGNVRCEDCFQREECIAQVMILLQEEYWVEAWRVQLEWHNITYN